MKLVALLLVLALAGCTERQRALPSGAAAGARVSVLHAQSEPRKDAAVIVKIVGSRPGRPPLERLLLDVQVKNDSSSARWVLLPSHLPQTPGGIDKLEQLTAKAGTATIAVGRFLGRGGRYAVRLAPGVHLTLRKLEVAWWREDGVKEATFDVQFASDVALGSEPMASWFDKEPTITATADVDMQAARHTASHRAPGDKEVAVSVTSGNVTSVKLSAP